MNHRDTENTEEKKIVGRARYPLRRPLGSYPFYDEFQVNGYLVYVSYPSRWLHRRFRREADALFHLISQKIDEAKCLADAKARHDAKQTPSDTDQLGPLLVMGRIHVDLKDGNHGFTFLCCDPEDWGLDESYMIDVSWKLDGALELDESA